MRSALVTGASRGIGRGIAVSLARQGYGLTLTSRNATDLAKLASDLRSEGAAEVVHLAADLANRSAVPRVVETHRRSFPAMDALILSAGVGTAGPIASYPLQRLDRTIQVNLVSGFMLVQHSLPLLRAAATRNPERGAKVIGLASMAGVYSEAGLAAYGATKAALISFIETLNAEESAQGISATTIAPGYVHTDMSEWVTSRIPAEKMIPVADVVAVADMLLGLTRATSIQKVIMARTGTSGYQA